MKAPRRAVPGRPRPCRWPVPPSVPPMCPAGAIPGGFDCSGLVQWAYKSVGINLPRTAREQSAVGKRITRVEDMRAGDIVAFHHPRRGYHTGIYVGDGKFVHSPRRRTRVRINSLDDPYFRTTFMGARRVEGSDAFSAEELRMAAYAEEQAVREISHSRSKTRPVSARRARGTRRAASRRTTAATRARAASAGRTAARRAASRKAVAAKARAASRKRAAARRAPASRDAIPRNSPSFRPQREGGMTRAPGRHIRSRSCFLS